MVNFVPLSQISTRLLNCNLQTLDIDDLFAVTEIHRDTFPESMLSLLGFEVVRRYYLWQFTGPHDVFSLGVFGDSGTLCGYCFGGIFRGALSGFLNANKYFLFWKVLTKPGIFLMPEFRRRFLPSFRLMRRERDTQFHLLQQETDQRKSFGILTIAIHPQFQGKGLGKLLMKRAENAAISQGFREMNLTVHPENTLAVEFYQKLGWEKVLDNSTAWSGRMTKNLVVENQRESSRAPS